MRYIIYLIACLYHQVYKCYFLTSSSYLQGTRSEDADIDEEAAVRDAEALRDAGDERWTPRSEKMSELLQSSSLLHFREVLLQYAEVSVRSLQSIFVKGYQ